jgi:flagellar FliJ protein
MLAEVAVLNEKNQQELHTAQTLHRSRRREVRGLEKLAEAHDERVRADELRGEQLEIDEIAGRMTGEA